MIASLKRWFDLFLVLIVAIFFWIIVFPVLDNMAKFLIIILTPWPIWIQFSINSLIVATLWSIIINLGGFRYKDILSFTFFRYPPVWFFGFIGFLIYLLLIAKLRIGVLGFFDYTNLLIILSQILFGVLLSLLIHMFSFNYSGALWKMNNKSQINEQNIKTIIEDPEKLLNWVENESPIVEPSQDIFGLSLIAKRISKILINKKTQNIGILGSYGIGKSSLINLVEYYLYEHNSGNRKSSSYRSLNSLKTITCRVDGWGRAKGPIAQQILTIAVKRISLEIDCLSIITVPANYQKALTSVKSPIATIFSALLNSEEDPVAILKRMDVILNTANIKLIIFLEDLDRNIPDEMIRNEMPALLDRISDFSNLSFVLAIGTEHQYSNMLIRICHHLESIA